VTIRIYIVALALVTVACGDWTETTEPVYPEERPNQEGWNSTATLTTDGVVSSEIEYVHMMRWDKRQLTTFNQGVIMNFFDKGEHSGHLTADSGAIYVSTKNVEALGHVVIISDSGLSMFTENVEWNEQKQRLFAEGRVTLTTLEDTLYGVEFESDRSLANWKMKSASGLSGRDIDLRTGTIRSRREQKSELDREVKDVLKENP